MSFLSMMMRIVDLAAAWGGHRCAAEKAGSAGSPATGRDSVGPATKALAAR
jgi:hypothetical protein